MKIAVDDLSELVLNCTWIEGLLSEQVDNSADDEECKDLIKSIHFFNELGNSIGNLRQAMIDNHIKVVGGSRNETKRI